MFALKCYHVTFHSLTEMSTDRIGQTEKLLTQRTVLKKVLYDIVGTFRRPAVIRCLHSGSAPEALCTPFVTPIIVTDVSLLKNREMD